jgi:hypothetical protein
MRLSTLLSISSQPETRISTKRLEHGPRRKKPDESPSDSIPADGGVNYIENWIGGVGYVKSKKTLCN